MGRQFSRSVEWDMIIASTRELAAPAVVDLFLKSEAIRKLKSRTTCFAHNNGIACYAAKRLTSHELLTVSCPVSMSR